MATSPDLSTWSIRELLKAYRSKNDANDKDALLQLIKEKAPHITHLTTVYKVAAPVEVLRNIPSTDPQDNKFVSRPDITLGRSFALLPALLPNAATVRILEEAQHYQAGKLPVAVAKITIIAVVAAAETPQVGQTTWTTRSNISVEADEQGFHRVIQPTANFRAEPIVLVGKMQLPAGSRVYIDVVKIDNYVNRNTFGFAVDADTQEEYGWIPTNQLVGKMDRELFGLREAPYRSIDPHHFTVGDQLAIVLGQKGFHFALQTTLLPMNLPVKILQEENHLGTGGVVAVVAIQGADGTDWGWTTRTNLSMQPDAAGFYRLIKPDSNVRSAPVPVYEATAKVIPQGARVEASEGAKALKWKADGQLEPVEISKVTVYKGTETVAGFADLWTLSSNLVKGWGDFKGPNAMWRRGDYIGQATLLDVIGEEGESGKQIVMNDGMGMQIERLLRDAEQENIPLSISSGFRDYKKQEQLDRDQDNAAPAGRSDHEAGESVDLNNKHNSTVYEWLKQNAWKYGLVQTYPWFTGAKGSGGEGHHWDYRPELAKEGYYTYFMNTHQAGVTFGTGKGQVDPRVRSNETWMTGPEGSPGGKGSFRIWETATGKKVELRRN